MRKKIFYVVVFLFASQLLALSNNNAAGEHRSCGDEAKCTEQKKPASTGVAELPDESSDISPIANFFLLEI